MDPADIICKLGLNPSVQQDAQEFSKLFVSLLEDTLRHQSRQEVRGMIQNQFRGEYAYVTTCLTCKKDSIRPEHFYELDLPLTGNKTLADCLADFLQVLLFLNSDKLLSRFLANFVFSSEVSQSSSIEEVDYTAEYVFSNTRVFPATFPIHLKSKIDRDNQEYDEEQEERHHSRMAEINEQQNKRRTMIQQYRGLR